MFMIEIHCVITWQFLRQYIVFKAPCKKLTPTDIFLTRVSSVFLYFFPILFCYTPYSEYRLNPSEYNTFSLVTYLVLLDYINIRVS
jgi:hypothetical protein